MEQTATPAGSFWTVPGVLSGKKALIPASPQLAAYFRLKAISYHKKPAQVASFQYCDNNVTGFWSTYEIVSVGKVHINSAFRARQSKLSTWSDMTAPTTNNPAGRRTSNG